MASRHVRRAAGALVLLLPSSVASAAPVEPRSSSLAWVRAEGAEECIGGKELAEAVERTLGRRVFVSASEGEVAVEGRIERRAEGPRWRATIRLSGADGKVLGDRELESDETSCRAVDASLVFVVALMIDPDAATRRPAPPPSNAAQAAPPAPSPRPERFQVVPAVGVTSSVGQLPYVAWGPSARVRVGLPVLSVELDGTLLFPQDQAVPGTSGPTVHFSSAWASASLCSTLARGASLSFLACAGAAAEVFDARPNGLLSARERNQTVLLADVIARAEWRLASPFFAALDARLLIPFSRDAYTVGDASGVPQPLFQPSVVAGAGTFSLGWVFE